MKKKSNINILSLGGVDKIRWGTRAGIRPDVAGYTVCF